MLEIVITSEIFISRPICELVNLFVICVLAEVCKCKLQVYSNLVWVVKKGSYKWSGSLSSWVQLSS